MKPDNLRLVVSDGNEGIIGAIAMELPFVCRQRCTVHKVRNIVGHSPRNLKGTAPGEASAIWKAPNKSEARDPVSSFIAKYEQSHPKLAAVIADDFDATLAFYDLDASIWRGMCSTNVIERVNREMRRKFNDMGACKGDLAVTRTAVLIAIKLEEDWKGTVVKGFKKRQERTARNQS